MLCLRELWVWLVMSRCDGQLSLTLCWLALIDASPEQIVSMVNFKGAIDMLLMSVMV